MAKRERQNELKIYLSDDEQYILEQKWNASNMKSKSAFIRHLILYGYVYDVNYEHLREYNPLSHRKQFEPDCQAYERHGQRL